MLLAGGGVYLIGSTLFSIILGISFIISSTILSIGVGVYDSTIFLVSTFGLSADLWIGGLLSLLSESAEIVANPINPMIANFDLFMLIIFYLLLFEL